MRDVGRPKNNDYPPYMTVDGDRGGFVVRNPINGKKKRFAADEESMARATAEALGRLIEAKRQNTLLNEGRTTVRMLTREWRDKRLPQMPWDESTRDAASSRLDRIDREFGDRFAEDLDSLYFQNWLESTAEKADPFNKWRWILVLVWRYAVSQKKVPTNEPEKVERRSTSRKIASNRKVRQQLDVEGFLQIHAKAEPFCQLAMETSLVTLQARREVCNIKHTDFRGGYLFVIRDKVAADSEMAFIKIRLTDEIQALRERSRHLNEIPTAPSHLCERAASLRAAGMALGAIAEQLGSTRKKITQLLCYQRNRPPTNIAVVSPYLIHRRPARRQSRWIQGKPHWTYVNESYLTRAFADARDQVARFAEMPDEKRPTFHEIRGLGARLQKQLGRPRSSIQELMTHADPSTTEIYLELGAGALTDDHFREVDAPFTFRELIAAR
jgi:integrase